MTTGRAPRRAEKTSRKRAERPTGPVYSDLTERELWFRQLIAGVTVNGRTEINPSYSRMCEQDRIAWERRNVVWFWGTDEHGKGVWSVDRPTGELLKLLKARGENVYMTRAAFDAARAQTEGRFVMVKRLD